MKLHTLTPFANFKDGIHFLYFALTMIFDIFTKANHNKDYSVV